MKELAVVVSIVVPQKYLHLLAQDIQYVLDEPDGFAPYEAEEVAALKDAYCQLMGACNSILSSAEEPDVDPDF